MEEQKTMNIYAPKGTKVKVIVGQDGQPINGDDSDKITIQAYLKPNQEYTISHTKVFNWETEVYLEEVGPNVPFNSVCLTEVEPKKIQKFKSWTPLSSQIRTTSYNEEEKYMFVEYTNGAKYRYAGVTLDVWEKSLKAISIGKFINTDIKPNFEFKKLN